jgi:transcriptional regulator with XRE-family HTH domain
MARTKLRKPVLAEKLRRIRMELGLSQNQMISKMGLEGKLLREEVSDFERNRRIPPLEVVLQYARAISTTGGGEFLEALIDDEMELPKKLPADPRVSGIKRKKGAKK